MSGPVPGATLSFQRPMDDWELLEQYRTDRSQEAFTRLVERHAGLVYGVCRRRLRDAHLAEDAAQAVFLLLARRPPRRRGSAALAGWLHQTSIYACMNMNRAQRIRENHEQAAAQQRELEQLSRAAHRTMDGAQVALDEALSRMSSKDRDALLLRYYQELDVRTVGAAMGISEAAASKRITRAMEKLRATMQSAPGLAAPLSAAGIAALLADTTKAAAPAGLVSQLSSIGVSQAVTSTLASEIFTGVLIMTRQAQLKLVAAVAGFALLGGGIVATVTTIALRDSSASPNVALAAQAPGQNSSPKASAEDIKRAKELQRQGWTLWQQQRFDEAAEKFQQSIELVSTDADTWNGLGWSRFNGGDAEAGKGAFEKCVELSPTHPAGLNGLGQVALARGQFDEAEKQFLKCADRAAAAAYGLARVYLLQGKWAEAEKWIAKFVDATPGAEDDMYKRMLAAAKQQKLDDDLRAMLAPPAASDAAQQVMRAFSLMQHGKMQEAGELFDEALAAAPEDPDVLNGVGWYKLNTGQPDEAQSLFDEALAKSPSHAAAMNGLAQCYRQQGRIDEAIVLWEKMMQLSPQANAGTYSLAQVYLERGEFEKALPLWEQLAKAMPQNEQVQASLAAAREGAKK